MAEPTQREHELAHALDEKLIEIEQLGLSVEEHTRRGRALLAMALASYRAELAAVPPTLLRVALSADGKRAEFCFGQWSALIAPGKAFEMAIALQHIAAQARGNGG